LGYATEGLAGADPRTSRSGRSPRIDERIRGNSLERLLRHFLLFFLGAATSSGIHGVDRERGAKILATDSMGRDSAGAYRRLIEALRADDRPVLEA